MNTYISRQMTNIIKGLAIFFVVFGHLGIIKNAGSWGVGLFLIISGYGLTVSFFNKGFKKFFSKKFKHICIPYIAITCLWITIDKLCGTNYSFFQILFSIFCVNVNSVIDPTMWYIPFIFIWYFIFYLIFKNINSNMFRVITLFILAIVLIPLVKSNLFNPDVGAVLYIFQFPLGVLIAIIFNKTNVLKYGNTKNILSFIAIICSVVAISTYGKINNSIIYFINMNAVCYITIFLISIVKINTSFFEKLGEISYEIYLVEFVFIVKYNFIFMTIKNKIISTICYLMFIILMAMVIKKFFIYIYNKVNL